MGKMYHYSNESFGRTKKSSFLHRKTWYMANTVLKSSRISILLFEIKSLSHHYIHTSHLKSSFSNITDSYTNHTVTYTHLGYMRCSQWYILRSRFLGRDTVQFLREEPVCGNLLPPLSEHPKDKGRTLL